jgi:translation initiation factor 3 subunit I
MTGKEIGVIPGHFGPVNTILFHLDGRGFISGGEEGNVRLHRFDQTYFED